MKASRDGGPRAAAMRFIMLAVLIDMVAIGIVVPVLPTLLGSFTGSAAERALWFGVMAFAFSFANFLGSPVLGALSDRFGRRPVLLVGFCGLGFNFFAMAAVDSLWALILVRMVGGALQANVAVANAYVADISTPDDRARRYGQLGAMFGLGFMLGPVIGGTLGAIDLRLPFWLAGACALANLVYGYFVLPESLPPDRRRTVRLISTNPVASLSRLRRLKGIGSLAAVIALVNLATFVMYTTWVLYTTYRFNWGTAQNGWSLFAIGLVSTLIQGFALKGLLQRMGARRLALAGLLSGGLGYIGWGLASESWMMFAVIALNLLGCTVTASLQSLIANAADPRTQGDTMGAVSSLASLMAVMAPPLGAPLMAMVSDLPVTDWRVGAPMYCCGLLQLAALGFAWRYFHPKQHA